MIRLQRKDISLDDLVAEVQQDAAGAVAVFLGTVRSDAGVKSLQYELYEGMAESELAKLRDRALERFDLLDLAVVHRRGRLTVGERVVAIAAVAPHRREAIDACSWAMDELKRLVPIWKEEVHDS